MASAMSRTENSSKHSSAASAASAAATGRNRLVAQNFAALLELPPFVYARVHIGHESVEMGAAFRRNLGRVEEQVHQKGFSPPDFAVDIEAARRLRRFSAQPSAEQAHSGREPVAVEPIGELIELFCQCELRGVGFDLSRFDQRAIARDDAVHQRRLRGQKTGAMFLLPN